MARARALILAAGRGRRLEPLTDGRPKALVPLGGKPLLRWQIEALHAAGIADVAVVAGYRAEQIAALGLPHFVNPEWAKNQMVASLMRAHDWLLEAPCVVAYGDLAYHPDVVARLLADDRPIATTYDRRWLSLWASRFDDPREDAESLVVREGRVEEIGGRISDLGAVDGQYMGLLRFTPAGWHRIDRWLRGRPLEERRRLQMTQMLDALIRDGIEVGAVPVDGRWCEVDTLRDLELYEDLLQRGASWTHDWRWT